MARVLYIWQGRYPWEVRVEKFCLALQAAGHEVAVLARWKAGQAREEDIQATRVMRVGHGLPGPATLPVPFNPVWAAAIRRAITDWRPDIVLAREIMLAEPAATVCRKRGIPLVMDMAEHYPATMRTFEKYRRGIPKLLVCDARLPDRVERRAVARANGIITVCEEQNDRLHALYGYPRERMAVVHNTPDLGMFAAVRRGSSCPPRVFGYHGHMTAQRGLDRLIRGFALIAPHHPEARLDLAGDGESRPALMQLVQECGLADRARFTGRYRFEDLVTLYSETDVGLVVYPVDESTEHTLGNKVFDYFACGKPVIASPTIPLRRLIAETRAGLVLEGDTPEAIAAGLAAAASSEPTAWSENGLAVAHTKYNWACDQQVLLTFLASLLHNKHS